MPKAEKPRDIDILKQCVKSASDRIILGLETVKSIDIYEDCNTIKIEAVWEKGRFVGEVLEVDGVEKIKISD